MLTNRKEQNNKQSPIEVEVFKWGEDTKNELKLTADRQYLKDFIKENSKSYSARGFYTVRENALAKSKGFGESNDDKEFVEKDFVDELWKKQATSFFESSDSPQRLIFCCGSRSNYVYDLKLENGLVKLYTDEDIKLGNAIGLQKKPFVRQIDLIEKDFMSFVTNSKEAKYKKTTDLNDKILGNLKETQITSLPEILKIPRECYEHKDNYNTKESEAAQKEESKLIVPQKNELQNSQKYEESKGPVKI